METMKSFLLNQRMRVALTSCLAALLLVPFAPRPVGAQGTSTSFSSGSTGADGAFAPTTSQSVQLPASGVFNFTTVTIPTSVTITFIRNARNTPVTILASGDVNISGQINVSGTGGNGVFPGQGGPGGFDGGPAGSGFTGNLSGLTGNGPGAGGGGGGGTSSTAAGIGGGAGKMDPFDLPDPLPAHWGGADRKVKCHGRWYHLTVGYGHRTVMVWRKMHGDEDQYPQDVIDNTLAPSWITIHCDPHEPGTLKHFFQDWVLKKVHPIGPFLGPIGLF
jgi:hypothetical protein